MAENNDAGAFNQSDNPAPSPIGVHDEPPKAKLPSTKDRIIEAMMELAAERDWSDFGITDIATRASVSLADFRDAFPSKGAALAGFSRKIDRIVLDGTTTDLDEETAKDRLFDVLMRRLDAMAPYRLGLESVAEWVRSDGLAAAALNQVALNSMRFMLEAAGIDSEGRTGAVKLQGLVVAWARILNIWLNDDETGMAKTMAALDRELQRGEMLSARVDDLDRLASPLRLLGRAVMDTRRRMKERKRDTSSTSRRDAEFDAIDPEI
ncbi:TetR/AcrR family transcriptional regulator [Lichenihabitans sp. PAMC28606]|uniref:TetR/AcrR family transcriptional regulator n=1 Tax=Lichenihabitans sp. PAMC28606 TaxID=2880932 RepID=UPI001D09CE54|nr:TetR/AcrR family transcriptional regulator [Lichenihabitans sp. PAMC28606]UDL93886.1 TetR/AcrR family transcriptional regulator [Lichenihabitans sp. PAMC28606]